MNDHLPETEQDQDNCRTRQELAGAIDQRRFSGQNQTAKHEKSAEDRGEHRMTNRLAMARLKTRVDPEIPASVLSRSLSVRVQARIDEEGSVAVKGIRGGNTAVQNAVKTAVERWKFLPAIVEKQPRCVETEIEIVINR